MKPRHIRRTLKLTSAPQLFILLLRASLTASYQQHAGMNISYHEPERAIDVFAVDADIAVRARWATPRDKVIASGCKISHGRAIAARSMRHGA